MNIQKELEQLDRDELNDILLDMLFRKKIDFDMLSRLHVMALDKQNKDNSDIIFGLSIPLIQYWEKDKRTDRQGLFMRCKGAYYMLKAGVYHTALVEKDLQELVDKHNYLED